MNFIEVKNLYKVFGKAPQRAFSLIEQGKTKDEIFEKTELSIAVRNANFDIQEGEFFVVMGLSGSGKSTMLRCFNRIIEPTKGEILIRGENILKKGEEALRGYRRNFFSMVFQHFALFPHRSVRENVEYGLSIQGVDDQIKKDKAYEMLELVGLKGYEEVMPSELSGGMQQRVGLARALANDPEVLLMDEAFSALDPLIRTEMQDELLNLQSTMKKTIIFITHDLDEALKLGDRIAIMKDGEIIQIDTPEQILINPKTQYVKDFVKDVNRVNVITASTIMKKAIAVSLEKNGPTSAMRLMKDKGLESIFIVNKDRHVVGYVTIEDTDKLIREKQNTFNDMIKEAKLVDGDTSIDHMLSYTVNASHPIAVVDENKKLKGVIDKSAILAGLLGEGDYNV